MIGRKLFSENNEYLMFSNYFTPVVKQVVKKFGKMFTLWIIRGHLWTLK